MSTPGAVCKGCSQSSQLHVVGVLLEEGRASLGWDVQKDMRQGPNGQDATPATEVIEEFSQVCMNNLAGRRLGL